MMIQGFMIQGIGNISNKIGKNTRQRDSKGFNSDFNKALDIKSKEIDVKEKNKLENKVQKDSNDLAKNYEVSSNIRKINVKENVKKDESSTKEKEHLQEDNTIKSKEDEVIEELVQSVNNILAVFQNITDFNIENLEDLNLENLNLEISVDQLESLKVALENIVGNFELKENNLSIQETIKSIENIISSVYENGDTEVDAKKLLVDLKQVVDLIEIEDKSEKTIIENEKTLENLKKLVNITEETNVNNEPKANIVDKKDSKIEPKVKVTSIKNEKLESVPESEIEDIISGDSLDVLEVNIKEEKVNIEKVISNELTNAQNNIQINQQLNNKQDMSIDKNILNVQQYLDLDKVDIIKQVTNKIKADYDNQINEIKIKLSPEHLGNLTIKVTLERGIITARALVENLNVKQMLELNINELKDNLKEQGISFESIDVSVGQDSEYDQSNSQAFAENKKIKIPKIKIDNSNSMNLYEDIEENLQGQNSSVGEGSVDITI